jgi:hypothetical protein
MSSKPPPKTSQNTQLASVSDATCTVTRSQDRTNIKQNYLFFGNRPTFTTFHAFLLALHAFLLAQPAFLSCGGRFLLARGRFLEARHGFLLESDGFLLVRHAFLLAGDAFLLARHAFLLAGNAFIFFPKMCFERQPTFERVRCADLISTAAYFSKKKK